jgi:hypothetical protein
VRPDGVIRHRSFGVIRRQGEMRSETDDARLPEAPTDRDIRPGARPCSFANTGRASLIKTRARDAASGIPDIRLSSRQVAVVRRNGMSAGHASWDRRCVLFPRQTNG